MAENLKVNAKSKILTFKKKHNLLVDSSSIQLNVSNIKELSDEDIESLKCGDIVNKVDSSGKHAYVVSFKNDTGICLTYADASCIETQSYDKIEGHWVYNSEDQTPNLLDVQTENDVKEIIESGLVENAKPIYWHTIKFQRGGTGATSSVSRLIGMMIILTNSAEPITLSNFIDLLKIDGFYGVVINGKGSSNPAASLESMYELIALKYRDQYSCTAIYRNPTANTENEDTINLSPTSSWVYFEDLGANKLN